MGQVFSATNNFNNTQCSILSDEDIPKTPSDVFLESDPRSPTFDYDRTPIRIDNDGNGSNPNLENEENSPVSSKVGYRSRSLHQRLMVKKLSTQES